MKLIYRELSHLPVILAFDPKLNPSLPTLIPTNGEGCALIADATSVSDLEAVSHQALKRFGRVLVIHIEVLNAPLSRKRLNACVLSDTFHTPKRLRTRLTRAISNTFTLRSDLPCKVSIPEHFSGKNSSYSTLGLKLDPRILSPENSIERHSVGRGIKHLIDDFTHG